MATDKKDKTVKKKRPTALKRHEQSEKKRLINRTFRAKVRTVMRGFEEAVEKADQTKGKESLKEVFSLMDKGVKKGIYKINKANRTKARMVARLAKAVA